MSINIKDFASFDKATKYQMDQWLEGVSLHNPWSDTGLVDGTGMCVPDFSCCHKELSWPIEKRKEFVNASRRRRAEMLDESVTAKHDLLDHERTDIKDAKDEVISSIDVEITSNDHGTVRVEKYTIPMVRHKSSGEINEMILMALARNAKVNEELEARLEEMNRRLVLTEVAMALLTAADSVARDKDHT